VYNGDELEAHHHDADISALDGEPTEYFDAEQANALAENQDDVHFDEPDFELNSTGLDPVINGTYSVNTTTESPAILDPEDELDFDDDTEEQHLARKASAHELTGSGAASPLGKRAFDATDSLYDGEDEPELKKARAA
jgi:hypothetical protein